MRKEDKNQLIEVLTEELLQASTFYLTDTSAMNSENTSQLRRLCFKQDIRLKVVKNTLLHKAMERTGRNYSDLYPALKGSTSIMFSEAGNGPARLIKEFKEKFKSERPVLKGAYVEETSYLGENQLEFLINVKSRNELIGDLIGLLQSPARNVISALQSSGGKLAGIVKTLSERPE
ncbi:MAG TPA: 50S ribosomal protein L10 [Bacteroidales bacterium]|nr:MAG: 50S ribosomal protein L10 [Bacteroidetes bacterium GWE2_42_24]OFY29528.1 MAG: 50S ribosomal protein L10 [Bacteroidetes bacterium GWF2_43_11]PKP27282.1 MAG: 50S ribosomal protein L10 [Bacteroidetes bacterium HGW-Bacteroidetes-22]HAQ64731.1 50S ribosomal protein L10 [Bacteroidales bacterium]HBZ67328.1 50S ribosomal protein L10 [Bacteroidales bacterium]